MTTLVGKTIKWVSDSLFSDDVRGGKIVGFNVVEVYSTGVVVKETPLQVWIKDDSGAEIKFFRKKQLLDQVRHKKIRKLIEESMPPRRLQNDEEEHIVYSLKDRSNIVHYVGITKDTQRRYRQHCQCQGLNLDLNLWIQNLARQGELPILAIEERVKGAGLAQQRESRWIQYYTALNMPLKNVAKVAGRAK